MYFSVLCNFQVSLICIFQVIFICISATLKFYTTRNSNLHFSGNLNLYFSVPWNCILLSYFTVPWNFCCILQRNLKLYRTVIFITEITWALGIYSRYSRILRKSFETSFLKHSLPGVQFLDRFLGGSAP